MIYCHDMPEVVEILRQLLRQAMQEVPAEGDGEKDSLKKVKSEEAVADAVENK